VRGYRGAQPKPPWASMAGEMIPAPAVLMAAKPMKKRELEQYENIYGPVWDQEPNASLRIVKSRPFMRAGPFMQAQQALGAAARQMAYLLFSEVLVQGLSVQFCLRCGAAFLFGKKQKYCSKQCGHIDSGKQSKSRTEPRKNRDRVRVASQAIVGWIDRGGRRDWRGSVEKKLSETKVKSNKEGTKDEYLIYPSSNKSQWLGRCIRAAGSSDDSPQRARLVGLCAGPGSSEEERKKVLKDLLTFYTLIQKAQSREQLFKSKRARPPAANATRRRAAASG